MWQLALRQCDECCATGVNTGPIGALWKESQAGVLGKTSFFSECQPFATPCSHREMDGSVHTGFKLECNPQVMNTCIKPILGI